MLPDGPVDGCEACFYANPARAFDRAGLADSTIAALERSLTAHGLVTINEMVVLAGPFEKRLGELYEAKGDRDKAHSPSARFVELWKDADPELQLRVAEVRARLRRLGDREGVSR